MIENRRWLIGQAYFQYFLVLLLIVAVLMDFKYDRIDNGWIVLGIWLGIFFHMRVNGWHGIAGIFISMLLPFLLLYPVYRIGGLGAGDVKLFVMTGAFLPGKRVLYVLACAFIVGAVFSLAKLVSEGNFKERIHYFYSYLLDVVLSGKWKLYGENEIQDYENYKRNKIHFALPICISVMLGMGGLF